MTKKEFELIIEFAKDHSKCTKKDCEVYSCSELSEIKACTFARRLLQTVEECERIKSEVEFYHKQLPLIYDEITGRTLSYPNYDAKTVISAFYDDQERRKESWQEDNDIQELRSQLQRAESVVKAAMEFRGNLTDKTAREMCTQEYDSVGLLTNALCEYRETIK